jgi:hypothetical protein
MAPQLATNSLEAENATLLDESVCKEDGESVERSAAVRYLKASPISKCGRIHYVLLRVLLLFMGLHIVWDFRTHDLSLKNDPSQGFF